jgi:DEAD/DEAH box helicase domain-containing protein
MKMEGGEDPNHVFPLRDVESQFQVELKQGPDQRALGSLNHSQVLREAYPGAVYYYTGQPFRIYRVYQQAKKIQARHESHYTTKPIALPTLVFPNLSPGNVHRALRLGDLTVVDCNLQIRDIIVGFKERRGPNEFAVQYPLSPDGGIRFDLPRFTRNYFTTGVVFTHPAFSRPGVHGDLCAQLLYESFISLIPFERQDVGAACDRHRTDREAMRRGQVFAALHDQTYGSLRLSSRVLDGDHLVRVLERLAHIVETGDISTAEPITARALTDVAREAEASSQTLTLDGPQVGRPGAGVTIKVIMPGSRGLNLRRNNEEYEVQRVFFSPTLQAVAYRGRHLATVDEDVVEIVPVEVVEPIPGESVMGQYDPETGELGELGPVS